MIAYDVAMKVLDRLISSAQHRWPDLWHYICFIQSDAFMVKRNTHTHTHTHTHKCKKMYKYELSKIE